MQSDVARYSLLC